MTLNMHPSQPSEALEAATGIDAPTAPGAAPAANPKAAPGATPGAANEGRPSHSRAIYEGFRTTLLVEIDAMSRHLLSEGRQIDEMTAAILQRLERDEQPTIEELTEAHNNLAGIIAPATPRAICALKEGQGAGGLARLLGPTPAVRRLTGANLLFALLFFGLSVSPTINHETIALSIYDQSGSALVIKLLFIMSAAGLGASFGALFEVWHEISEGRFDPLTESAHWMRIALGLVAGLVLAEIVGPEQSGATAATGSSMAEPLLALVGGFSARLVHLVVTRIVTAVEHTFEPPVSRPQAGARTSARTGAQRGPVRPGRSGAGEARPAQPAGRERAEGQAPEVAGTRRGAEADSNPQQG